MGANVCGYESVRSVPISPGNLDRDPAGVRRDYITELQCANKFGVFKGQ